MNYKQIEIGPVKKIALVAHDNKKQDLFEWAKFNRAWLDRPPRFFMRRGFRLADVTLEIRRYTALTQPRLQQRSSGAASVGTTSHTSTATFQANTSELILGGVPTPVPEPSSLLLLATGLLALGLLTRRRVWVA